MSDHDLEKSTKLFSSRYKLALIFVACLSLGTYFILSGLISSQKKYGKLINMSGKQRMLSQKAMLHLEQYLSSKDPIEKENLIKREEEILSLFEKNHYQIEKYLSHFIQSDSKPDNLAEDIFQYTEKIRSSMLKGQKDPFLTASFLEGLLTKLDRVVTLLEQEDRERTERLQVLEFGVVILTLIVLLLEAIFIFKPLQEKLIFTWKAIELEKDEALKAKELKSLFIKNMSHEFRTPIHAMMGVLNLINKAQFPKESRKLLGVLHNSAESLQYLVEDILDFEKLSSGKVTLAPQWESFSSFGYEMEEWSTVINTGNQIDFKLENHLENKEVFVDKIRLKKLLTSLLMNAFEYTEKGLVRLDISQDDRHVIFSVSDTGKGIKKEELDKIFESFVRVRESNYQKKGVGLGLATCKILVEAFQGNLEIDTGCDGTCFKVKLPLDVRGVEEKSKPSRKIYDVLVLEDNRVNQLIIKRYLQKMGLTSQYAENGHEGLRILKNHRFDLILSDIMMPEMDGVTFCKMAHEQGLIGDIPIVAFSANTDKNDVKGYIEAGFVAFLPKPLQYETLKNFIDDLNVKSVTKKSA